MILRPTLALLAVTLLPVAARAAEQAVPAAPPSPAPAAASAWSDEEGNPAIPDFTSINLPTTLRLPRHKLAFRVTHRFARPLGEGDFGDLAGDFFGFDSGAQIGLELRFGLFAGTQLGVYRTSDRTIQLFAQQDLLQQGPRPIGLAAFATFEGIDNLEVERSPGIALVASRTFGERAAVYVIPGWVGNTNLLDEEGDANNSFIVGLAGRLRLGEVYAIAGEVVPRIGGHQHQDTQIGFAFERRAGGHNFQINFGNALGSTLAQVARGGGAVHHEHGDHGGEEGRQWYIGFNLSRKFY
jgi:uncharacterized beta barrel domain-containing protein DUF5777